MYSFSVIAENIAVNHACRGVTIPTPITLSV